MNKIFRVFIIISVIATAVSIGDRKFSTHFESSQEDENEVTNSTTETSTAQPTNASGIDIQTVHQLLPMKCIMATGSMMSALKAKQSIRKFVGCLDFLNVEEVQVDLSNLNQRPFNETVAREYFEKYCPTRTKIFECLDKFSTDVDECFTRDEKEIKSEVNLVFKRLVENFCEDNGEKLIILARNGGDECITEHRDDIKNCITTSSRNKMLAQSNRGEKPLPSLFVRDADDCRFLDEALHCVTETLESCPNTSGNEFLTQVFGVIIGETVCKITKTQE